MTDEQTPPQPIFRNAVIHLQNEQPLIADLFDRPAPGDQGLLCTNLRTLEGKRPVFADHIGSIFFFPYHHIRFVEIHPPRDAQPALQAPTASQAAPEEADADLEIDEDFLRRIREV